LRRADCYENRVEHARITKGRVQSNTRSSLLQRVSATRVMEEPSAEFIASAEGGLYGRAGLCRAALY
jgi:hypothetical protein